MKKAYLVHCNAALATRRFNHSSVFVSKMPRRLEDMPWEERGGIKLVLTPFLGQQLPGRVDGEAEMDEHFRINQEVVFIE